MNNINQLFQEGNIFLVGHGYRDVVQFFDNRRLDVKIPPSLGPNLERVIQRRLLNYLTEFYQDLMFSQEFYIKNHWGRDVL